METQQDWHTESYKGMEVHVLPIAHSAVDSRWDYTVRVVYPGDDPSSDSEIIAKSGDDSDFATREAAVEAGFIKGYALVDEATK